MISGWTCHVRCLAYGSESSRHVAWERHVFYRLTVHKVGAADHISFGDVSIEGLVLRKAPFHPRHLDTSMGLRSQRSPCSVIAEAIPKYEAISGDVFELNTDA